MTTSFSTPTDEPKAGEATMTEATMACPTAIERARAGDREAFGEIYETYVDQVHRYVRSWVREPADAEDLTSEVFIRAFSHIHRYRWEGKSFAAWLFTIARNAIIDRRRRQRPTVDLAEAMQLASDGPTALDLAVRAERMDTLNGVMNCLTSDQRSVVTLRYVDDLPSAKVASTIGKGNGAVRALQFRAVARLRRALREDNTYSEIVAEWSADPASDASTCSKRPSA